VSLLITLFLLLYFVENTLAFVHHLLTFRVQGNLDQQFTLVLLAEFGNSTRSWTENSSRAFAIGAYESTHVFNHPDQWYIGFAAKV
jgi:hypothetical protein